MMMPNLGYQQVTPQKSDAQMKTRTEKSEENMHARTSSSKKAQLSTPRFLFKGKVSSEKKKTAHMTTQDISVGSIDHNHDLALFSPHQDSTDKEKNIHSVEAFTLHSCQ